MARRRTSLMVILWLLVGGYVAVCVLLYFRQDAMLFFPHRTPNLEREAALSGFEPWLNADGQRIGWQSKDGDSKNAQLVLHGNGGHALHRNYFHYAFRSGGEQWKTFLLEYPGYGDRPGSPSEATLTAAAVEALDLLAAMPERRIWVLGQSMGSGVASALAARRPERVSGLILVTPFDSLVGAARSYYPWLPVNWLLRTRFDSEKNLAAFPGPVAFILAERDTIVPVRLGQKLFDGYSGIKRLWLVPGAEHNDSERLLRDWPEIVKWLKRFSIVAPQNVGGLQGQPDGFDQKSGLRNALESPHP